MRGLSDDKENTARANGKAQILNYIYKLHEQGENRLPTEHKLIQLLGLSRTTVRSILDELMTEGRIYRKQGSGSYINPALSKIKATLFPARLIQDSIRDCGYTPTGRYLGHRIEVAQATVSEALELPQNANIVAASILFFADGNPCAYCNNFWDASLLTSQQLERLYEANSIFFELAAQYAGRGVFWDTVKLDVTTTMEHPELASQFNCSANGVKSFLVLKTISYDGQNRPLLYSVSYHDTNYMDFGMIRRKKVDRQRLKTDPE